MALSRYSLWELFPIGSGRRGRNAHATKAGPGRRTTVTTMSARTPRQRLAPAMGIGNWKGVPYLSYMAHDAQGGGPFGKWRRMLKYLFNVGAVSMEDYHYELLDEADAHLLFNDHMRALNARCG